MRRVERCGRGAILAVLLIAGKQPSGVRAAEVALLAGKLARLRVGDDEIKVTVQFRGDAIAPPLGDPTCPARSTLRLATAPDTSTDIDLPCANWRRTERGYRYVDASPAPGFVRGMTLGSEKLVVRLRGGAPAPVAVPVPFVEIGLAVNDDEICGRFARFTRNAGGEVRALGPTDRCRAPRPNVLLVLLDDARADGLDRMTVYNDRFAPEAARFVDSFVPNSLCCPSRASSLTGLYAVRHGARSIVPPLGGAEVFRESGADRETLPVWLKAAGYRTGLFGKYLNGYVAESHAGLSLGEILRGETPPWRSDFLLEHWRQERSTTVAYSAQPSDGDRLSLLYGDVRARPRAALLFEFDDGGGVADGAEPIAIDADADATFANLGAAIAGAGGWTVTHNAVSNQLNVDPGDAIDDAPFFRVESVQADAFEASAPKPDYFGVRDVANQMIWVEYESGERELYDLAVDPDQLDSRHDDPAYASERQRLEDRLDVLFEEIESRAP